MEQYRPGAVVCVGQAGAGEAAITPGDDSREHKWTRAFQQRRKQAVPRAYNKEEEKRIFPHFRWKDIEKNLNDNGIPSSVS